MTNNFILFDLNFCGIHMAENSSFKNQKEYTMKILLIATQYYPNRQSVVQFRMYFFSHISGTYQHIHTQVNSHMCYVAYSIFPHLWHIYSIHYSAPTLCCLINLESHTSSLLKDQALFFFFLAAWYSTVLNIILTLNS